MRSDQDWQAESDLNTLIEAEKVKKDPKRLQRVMVRKRALLKALADVPASKKKKTKKKPTYS